MADGLSALLALDLPGGLIKDVTEYDAGPKCIDTKNVRWRATGRAEKLGGWQSEVNFSFTGIPRAAINWRTLEGNDCLVVCTQCRVEIVYDGVKFDITPAETTLNPMTNDPFAVTSGSSEVVVTWAGHGAIVGTRVIFSGATAIHGITLDDEYEITEIVNANSFKVDAGSNASGTGSGGGAAIIGQLLLNCGNTQATPGLGWGAGPWNRGTWNTPRNVATSGISLESRLWSLDLWGEDLIIGVRNGKVYRWDASAGPGTRAAQITGTPDRVRFIRISSPDLHLVLFGSEPDGGGDQDPMLILWSDRGDYEVYTPTATNDAGDKRLGIGTKLVGVILTRDTFMVSTDGAIYAMTFQGPPYTFAFKLVSATSSAAMISQNSGCDFFGTGYYMGKDGFYRYQGSVTRVPCPVERFIFDDLNRSQVDCITCGVNGKFEEIWWFVPKTGDVNPTRLVIFKPLTGQFAVFDMERTVFVDAFSYITSPYALKADGTLVYHEQGYDDDNSPMEAYVTFGEIELKTTQDPDGTQLMLVRQFIPDISTTGEMTIEIETRKEPNGTAVAKGPFTVTQTTRKFGVRARGRQMEITFRSADLGNAWHLGRNRVRVQPDGYR